MLESSDKHILTDLSSINWQKLANEYTQKSPISQVRESQGFYEVKSISGIPKIPPALELRVYQHEAIVSWFRNKGRGILKMATGTGKTITALAIATELYAKISLKALIILCPYRHLVTQWAQECEKFNLQPILAFERVHHWHNQLSNQLYNLNADNQSFLTVIATNSTFLMESFQSQLKFFPQKTLLIGDEAHHLGAPRLEASLPRHIGLRLALSATPERYFDEDGTENLFNYFGSILKPELNLADAIKQKALVPYFYHPILVELTPSESVAYARLTQRIGWEINNHDEGIYSPILTSLLMQRSRLIGAATNKIVALRDLMSKRLETSHTFFYCGDGTVENNQEINRQVEAVTKLLGKELGYSVNTYTADTSLAERERILHQFEKGELQGIVAIHCLDEGIDIPSIENAVILASSRNPRQFIQRRGRILRPHSGKKRATLFDMVVIPPDLERDTWEIERQLLRKELLRFIEFANVADNADEACRQLLTLQEKFDLLDI